MFTDSTRPTWQPFVYFISCSWQVNRTECSWRRRQKDNTKHTQSDTHVRYMIHTGTSHIVEVVQKCVRKLCKWKNVTWCVFCQRSSIKCNFDIVSNRLCSRRLLESHVLCYSSHSSSSHNLNRQRQFCSSNPELIFIWLLTPILFWLWNSMCIWSSCDTLTAEVWSVSNYSSHLIMFKLLQLQFKCNTQLDHSSFYGADSRSKVLLFYSLNCIL